MDFHQNKSVVNWNPECKSYTYDFLGSIIDFFFSSLQVTETFIKKNNKSALIKIVTEKVDFHFFLLLF